MTSEEKQPTTDTEVANTRRNDVTNVTTNNTEMLLNKGHPTNSTERHLNQLWNTSPQLTLQNTSPQPTLPRNTSSTNSTELGTPPTLQNTSPQPTLQNTRHLQPTLQNHTSPQLTLQNKVTYQLYKNTSTPTNSTEQGHPPTLQNTSPQLTLQNTSPQLTLQNTSPQLTLQNTSPQLTLQNTSPHQLYRTRHLN
ncbi:integumentary mucin A.1-like [Homarus americanus]|uniref:integumentary mucin A.1-like n=1 Tax=Homarus americanus TaxID=6706 RepID=UPI001C4386BA|nr:integumentary mucin A.1-like [Homarus americanus]